MSTVAQLKEATKVAIRDKTLPSSVTRANVADQLDAAADELLARGMLQAADTAGLALISKDNTRSAVVPGIGLFTALQTASPADNVTTFASADAGWLWFLAVKFVTSLPLSSILAATAPSTINNVANTQEWQFPMVSGGTGFKITGNRVADNAITPETLFAIELAGSVTSTSRNRPIKGLSIVSTISNRPQVKLLHLEYNNTEFNSPTPNTAVAHIVTNNANVPILRLIGTVCNTDFGGTTLHAMNSFGGHRMQSHASQTITLPTLDLIASSLITAAVLRLSHLGNSLALEILNTTSETVNPLRNNAAFQTVSANAKKAAVSIGPSKDIRASLNIESGVAPSAPVDGDFWIQSNHLYCRLNGITLQLDEPDGANFYNGDGALSGIRVVDMGGFPLTFINSGKFRVEDDGADTGIYEFDNGVDFLVANATKSYSILKDLVNGIQLKSVDIPGGITKEIVIDTDQIKVDSSVLKLVNSQTFADDAAAAALDADTVYKTPTGELRIKL